MRQEPSLVLMIDISAKHERLIPGTKLRQERISPRWSNLESRGKSSQPGSSRPSSKSSRSTKRYLSPLRLSLIKKTCWIEVSAFNGDANWIQAVSNLLNFDLHKVSEASNKVASKLISLSNPSGKPSKAGGLGGRSEPALPDADPGEQGRPELHEEDGLAHARAEDVRHGRAHRHGSAQGRP